LLSLYQMDFKIEAKGVTPIPLRTRKSKPVSSTFSLSRGTKENETHAPTSKIVSNLVKSSEADPKGLRRTNQLRRNSVSSRSSFSTSTDFAFSFTHPSTITLGKVLFKGGDTTLATSFLSPIAFFSPSGFFSPRGALSGMLQPRALANAVVQSPATRMWTEM